MRYTKPKLIGIGIVVFLTWFSLIATTSNRSNAWTSTHSASASRASIIASPTPTVAPTVGPQVLGDINPAVWAALIALLGVVIGALINGYITRRNEQKRQEEQLRHDQEMARLQKDLEAQYKANEQAERQEAAKAEALREEMLRAQNNNERAKAYRQALRADPRIAYVQILDMNRSLEVTNIYVRPRLYQDTRARYEIDMPLLEAEAKKDPNAFLRAQQWHLEQRTTSALDPDEAIRTHKRCVIVGDPGVGKTILLKYLALRSVENQLPGLPDLPIHIELNAFADFASSGHQDLLDFASSRWEAHYGFPEVDAHTYMEEQLDAGKALLLLDGLDETVRGETVQEAESSYRRVSEAILQAATRFHQAPIVVTARKADYQQRAGLPGFTQLEVLDFREEDMQQFIRSWFDCRPNQSPYTTAADLQARIARNSRIQALAANPLLLSLIVLVYEGELKLPSRRIDLYNRCVETLLTRWDTNRDTRRLREFKPEDKQALLEEVAWYFHLQWKGYFLENELLRVVANFLRHAGLPADKNARFIAEIAAENGLLKAQAQGWYGFLDLALQEYFVAQYVMNHQQMEALLEHVGDPWWEEVFLLYAGGRVTDVSSLFQHLLGQSSTTPLKEDIFWTNLLLAGRCLATQPTPPTIEPTTRNEIITRLLHTLTQTPYSLTKELVVNVLAEIGGGEINTHLLHLLSNDKLNASVRGRIADALGKLGERNVAPDLVQLLSDEKLNTDVRERIAKALGELADDDTTVHALTKMLETPAIADADIVYTALEKVSRRAGFRPVL